MGDQEQDRTRDYLVQINRTPVGAEGGDPMWEDVDTVTATSRRQAFEKAKAIVQHDGMAMRLRLIPTRYCGIVTWRQTQTVLDTVEGL